MTLYLLTKKGLVKEKPSFLPMTYFGVLAFPVNDEEGVMQPHALNV
jgi:hypothetical protein